MDMEEIPDGPGFQFVGPQGCHRVEAGSVEVLGGAGRGLSKWFLFHYMDNNETKFYSMMATRKRQINFNFTQLQILCTNAQLPCPLEFLTYPGNGIGLLYPPFTALHSHYGTLQNPMESMKPVVRNLIEKLLFLQRRGIRPCTITDHSIVLVGSQATFLLPFVETVSGQEPFQNFKDLKNVILSLMGNATSEQWKIFTYCMSRANSPSRQNRFLYCPLLAPSIDSLWSFIKRAHDGYRSCKAFEEEMNKNVPVVADWGNRVLFNQHPRVAEAITIYQEGYGQYGTEYGVSATEVLHFLRNFNEHRREIYYQFASLQSYKGRLGAGQDLDMSRLRRFMNDDNPYLPYPAPKHVLFRLGIPDQKTLQTRLDLFNSKGITVAPDVEAGGRAVLSSVIQHFPDFFMSVFAASFGSKTPQKIDGLD